jgi:ADP-ribose pyrophosphatase
LVSQYRTAVERPVLEIPAGKLDATDRNPLLAAQRELAEEIGATATEWHFLARMLPSPGYTDEVLHLYAATGLSAGDRTPHGAEEELATIVTCRLDEALDRIENGEIIDAKTQIALLLWARQRREV